jgi:hypothetical protein
VLARAAHDQLVSHRSPLATQSSTLSASNTRSRS